MGDRRPEGLDLVGGVVGLVLRAVPHRSRRAPKHRGLSYLLVPMQQPGVEVRPIRQITGTAEFSEVFFDGARTDAANIVGEPGDGWKVANGTLAFERGASTLGQNLLFQNELARDHRGREAERRARATRCCASASPTRGSGSRSCATTRCACSPHASGAATAARGDDHQALLGHLAPQARQARDGRARARGARSARRFPYELDRRSSACSCSRAPTRSTPARTRSSAT